MSVSADNLPRMSTTEPTPPAAGREPTAADAVSVAHAGQAALEPGQSPEEAQRAMIAAMDARLRELKVELSQEQVQAIATATIAQLEARGAFEQSNSADSDESDDEEPAAEEEPVAPHKPTFAERFLHGGEAAR